MKRALALAVVAVMATAGAMVTPMLASPASAVGPPAVSSASTTTQEGDLGASPIAVKVPFTMNLAQATDVEVTWSVTGGTATPGVDYKAITKPKKTKIRAGKTRAFGTVAVYGDDTVEGFETVFVAITAVSGAGVAVGATPGVVIIHDDDGGTATTPALTIGDTHVYEGDEPGVSAPVKVPVRLSDPLPFDVVVNWAISGGNATAGVDYKAVPNARRTTIRAGRTSANISLVIYGDTIDDGDKIIEIDYVPPPGPAGVSYDIQTPTVTIFDDDDTAQPPTTNLWSWGYNQSGQLGIGTNSNMASPTSPMINPPMPFTDFSAGGFHTCGITTDGHAWCWGDNFWGQLGDPTTTGRNIPGMVLEPGTQFLTWADISAGGGHTCGVRTEGSLWCSGRNDEGQLGDGTRDEIHEMSFVGEDFDWTTVTASGLHTCAIKNNGSLWCWGDNRLGTLGDGTTDDRLEPVQIGTANDWRTVSSTGYQTCGLRGSGTLWCWGWNGYGQVGDGTTTDRLVPTEIGTGNDWMNVSAGFYHTCGVKTSGTMWCWGRNFSGELGDGTAVDRLDPTQVGTDTNWTDVAAGSSHSCGIRTNATLWCWGFNDFGALGNGTFDGSFVPEQASTVSNVLRVSAGLHTVVLVQP